MATQSELAAKLQTVVIQLKKSVEEIKTIQNEVVVSKHRITDLEAIIANGGEATPELVQAVQDVISQSQIVDDQIPDNP